MSRSGVRVPFPAPRPHGSRPPPPTTQVPRSPIVHDGGGAGGGGGGRSGGAVVAGAGDVGVGADLGADAGTDADAAPRAEAPDAGAAEVDALPAPRGAGEPAVTFAGGAAAVVAGPDGASVTDATGTRSPSGPSVGTRPSPGACTLPGAPTARPTPASRPLSSDTSPTNPTTINATDDPSAQSVAILVRRDSARIRRACRLLPERGLGLAAAFGLVAASGVVDSSSSSQKDVFRSQNASTIWIPPLRFLCERRRSKQTQSHPVSRVQRLKGDRKSTRLNSSHLGISYAVF